MATPSQVTPAEVACIVCGLKSHRADWQSNPSPACDSHSAAEVAAAKAKAKDQPAPASK